MHVGVGRLERVLQHARDFVVAQAVGRLDGDRGFHAGSSFRAPTPQQAVGIDLVRSRGCARRRPPSAECRAVRSAPARGSRLTSSRSPCTTWIAMRGLAVLEGGEFLGARAGNGAVARDDALRPARPWSRCRATAGSRPAAASRRPARGCRPADWPASRRPAPRLRRDRDWSAGWSEELADGLADVRHAGGAADQHHAVDVVHGQIGVAQGLARRRRWCVATRRCVSASKTRRRSRSDRHRLAGIERGVDGGFGFATDSNSLAARAPTISDCRCLRATSGAQLRMLHDPADRRGRSRRRRAPNRRRSR